jgi:RNA polymerase sigma-70 factor (ECF subfamily)
MDQSDGPDMGSYRDYLLMLARAQVGARGEGRPVIDPSDVVQQALLAAHERRGDFRGANADEHLAWLRTLRRRPDGWAASFERAIEDSSRRLDAWLAADDASPSSRLRLRERTLRLAAALARLPDDQRDAIEAHYLRGLTVPEVAAETGRTTASVAGLVRRGLQTLRGMLDDSSVGPAP